MAVFLVPVDKGRRIVVDKAVVFVGRHPDCDVVLTRSRKVSRKHCCIARVDDALVVRDLGSMNGVYVNGRRVEQTSALELGDELTIGDVSYTVKSARQVKSAEEPQSAGDRSSDASESAAPRREVREDRSAVRSPLPADFSQDVPIPIPEDHQPAADGGTDESLHEDSAEIEEAELVDESDDVILIDESDFENRGSHVELLSD